MEEHLHRLVAERSPLVLKTPMGVEVEGRFAGLEPDRGRLMIELTADPPPLEPDDALELFVTRRGQRWSMKAVLHHFPKPASLVLVAPQPLSCADRRQEPRWMAEEGAARAEVMTTLYEGLRIGGPLLSLSGSGFALRVEAVSGPQGTVPWRSSLLEEGRLLESAQILGLPVEVEAEGRVLWVEGDRLGVLIRGLSQESREALEGFVRSRAWVAPTTFIFEPLESAPPEEAAPVEAPGRSQALLRLKKRGRTLVLAMKAGHLREALRERLLAWGYGRVEMVDTVGQWLEFVQTQPVDLVFIDGGVKELQGVELASFLHQSRGDRGYAIVLAEQLMGSSIGLVAKRAGVTQLLGKPYTLDGKLDEVLEGALDLRAPIICETAPMPSAKHKRRAVALAMPPGPKRDALQTFLLSEGFSRVLPAGTVGELIRVLQSPTLGLVFVDWEESNLSGLEVAAFLAGQHGVTHPQLVLAGDEKVEEDALALGIARVVPRSYPLNGPLVRALLEAMEEMDAVV